MKRMLSICRGRLAVAGTITGMLALHAGCSVMDVDPLLSDVFPCETDDDCPPQQACVLQSCQLGEAPEVVVIAPEIETAFPIDDPDADVVVVVKIGGANLDLVEPGTDPDSEFGRGNVAVLLDGAEVAVLTAGELETGVTIEVAVPPQPGAHRIVALARNSDLTIYDNPGAQGRQFFWLDDGLPHVGFLRPFPGDVFPLEATKIDFGVAALNFSFETAMPGAIPGNEAKGHAHVHYEETFPECVFDQVCDNGYSGVVAPEGPATSASAVLTIPDSAAGEATLTATLRKVNHFKYLFPDENGQPIWEDITVRRADIGPLTDDADSDSDSGDGGDGGDGE